MIRMKDIAIIGITLLFFIEVCKAQFESLKIKELYDSLTISGYVVGPGSPADYGDLNTVAEANNLGDRMSYVLESYIRMYQITRDKAYLYKFMNHVIKIQEYRGEFGPYGDFAWSADSSFYMNGLILWPQAHFAHLVSVDEPALATIQLFQNYVFTNPDSTKQ